MAIYQQKNSRIVKLFDIFFSSQQNQISDLNRSILLAHDNLLLKAVERKGKNMLESNHLKRIQNDLDKLLKTQIPDKNLRPELTGVRYVGMTALRLANFTD